MDLRGCDFAILASNNLQSAAVLPIGPSTSKGDHIFDLLFVETMPLDGLIPAIPQKPAGVLNDPAKSEPVASGTIPDATAAAPPPVDAPALKSGLNGLPVLPCNGLVVVAPNPCSGTLVFPKIIAENLLKLLTTSSSSSATLSLKVVTRMMFLDPLHRSNLLCR